MKFEDYEKRYAALYTDFAEVVKFILERAISETAGIPRPQSIQSRAKDPASLERKLRQRQLLESDSIETEIKDFAGARLIFYTNTDVDRFLNSRLIPANFSIDYDATKIHHPIKENEGVRYQAIHYTVSLSEERLKLPEYSRFAGMRCELQIQTILNHAWSETSHDIIYKSEPGGGFGSKAMESIRSRFNQIMDKYLLPAGYDFQRVQQDYERLQVGKALFDRNAIQTIRDAKNNNERYDLLAVLKEHVLPNYDDIPGVYQDVSQVLVEVAKTARTAPVESVKTIFGDMEGKTAADVLSVITGIFTMLRYVDVERTFLALCDLLQDETDLDSRKHVVDAARQLAHYDLDAWRAVGPQIQLAMVDVVERVEPEKRAVLRPLLIAVWSEVLASDLRGTSWSADSMTLSRAALPTSVDLRAIRQKALSGLFDLFNRAISDPQRREILSTLREATRVPTSVEYSNELLAMSLSDAKRIVDFLTQLSGQLSYEMLERVEHDFLWDYHRARDLAADEQDPRRCRAVARELMSSIEAFRDSVNRNEQFVRYKMLVGFEGVFPPAWTDDDFEFEGIDLYRRERMKEYVASVSDANEEEWYGFTEQCAATKSDDLATFSVFRDFLHDLAKTRPAIAFRFLKRANEDLLNFLPAFLEGLRNSGSRTEYDATLARFMGAETHLGDLAFHLRNAGSAADAMVEELLGKAIATSNAVAVINCLILVIERGDQADRVLVDRVFTPAILYLTAQKDTRWIHAAAFLKCGKPFFSGRTSAQIGQVLENLLPLPRLEHHAERILGWLADKNAAAVWSYFGGRLSDPLESDGLRYQAIPYQFHGLEKILSRDVELGISIVRGWYCADASLFRYRGGRLLKAVFWSLPEPFVKQLAKVASEGTDEAIGFALGILHNFESERVLRPIVQELISQVGEDDERLVEIEIILQHFDMAAGAFGVVETYRRKKEEVASWLDDPRPRVKAFASRYIRKLEQLIASEQRSAEQRQEQRKRDFTPDDDC